MNALIKLVLLFTILKDSLQTLPGIVPDIVPKVIPNSLLPQPTPTLQKFNIDTNTISVSGVSGGGYFAVQFGVAHSSIIKGVGVIAGGFYDCFRQYQDFTQCGANNSAPVGGAIAQTNQWSGTLIDNTANMANQRVYMLGETLDPVVGVGPMRQLYKYYVTEGLYIPQQYVKYEERRLIHLLPRDSPALGLPNNAIIPCTADYPNIGSEAGLCGFDAAGALLNQIYANLNPRVELSQRTGSLITFDQSQFISNPIYNGVDNTGYAYVPKACKEGQQCRLHIFFHGCSNTYCTQAKCEIENTGYDLWADSNNIIILMPRAGVRLPGTLEPNVIFGSFAGCFDFSKAYDNLYDTKEGTQIKFVKNIIDYLSN